VKLLDSTLQKDKDGRVRVAAASALGFMKARKAIPALRTSLDDKEVPVRFAAAQALWKMGDHSGRFVLLNVLEGQSSPSGGMNQMIRQQWDDAEDKLHDPQGLAWMGVQEASGAFLGPFAIGVTMAGELARDKGAPARVLSASMLASDRDPRTVRDLDESLGDSNWVVRTAAAKALANHPCSQLIPDLQPFLLEKRDELRLTAATALLRISANVKSSLAPSAECELLHGATRPAAPPRETAGQVQHSAPGSESASVSPAQ
jgi:HEAT repeat protein